MAVHKLTNQFCNAVKFSGKHNQKNYFDTEIKGFMLEVRKSGGKSFYLRYQRNKITKIEKIGDAVAMTASQARDAAKRIKSSIALGKDLYAEKQTLKNTPTLNEFYTKYYLPNIKHRKRSWCHGFLIKN